MLIMNNKKMIKFDVDNQNKVREISNFYQRALINFFNDKIYSIDFLRELVQARDESNKRALQDEIISYILYVKRKTEGDILAAALVNFNDTKAVLQNTINYIKYCKVIKDEIKDYLPMLLKYQKRSGNSLIQKKELVVIDEDGNVIDNLAGLYGW